MPRRKFFQDAAGNFLQLAKASEVILKIVVECLCVLRTQLGAQDHIAQFDGMGQQRVFLKLVERGPGVIVIHRVPQRKNVDIYIVLAPETASEALRKPESARRIKRLRPPREGTRSARF
jgi:hypothetical protein